MPITLNPEMTLGPTNHHWSFGGTKSEEGSDVIEQFTQLVPHQRIVEIFETAIGQLPADGVGVQDVIDHWNQLEPSLTDEVEQQMDE